MRIGGIPGLPQPENNKGDKAEKVERSSGDAFVKSGDARIDFKTFISIASKAPQMNGARQKHVQEIKQLVQSGQYSIDVENIAKKMIESMGELK